LYGGTASLGLTIQNFNDVNGAVLGSPTGIGASVTIMSATTASPTEVPTPEPTPTEAPTAIPTEPPGAGEVWISPASQTIPVDGTPTVEIHANTGNKMLGAFEVRLEYDSYFFTCQGAEAIQPEIMYAVGTGASGVIIIQGFDASGLSAGTDVPLMRVKLTPISGVYGSSLINLNIISLVDTSGSPIGTQYATAA